MGKKLVISDTADIVIIDKVTGKTILNAEAQLASITGALNTEDLFGGIGNKRLFQIRNQKTIDVTMRSAVVDVDFWALTQGVAISEGTATVTKYISGVVGTDGTTVTLESAPPVGADLFIQDAADGSEEAITVTDKTFPVPEGVALKAGDRVTAFYLDEITGNSIVFDATKFSNKVRLEMRTIAYDLATSQVASDIYFIFDEALPSSEFEIGLENGSILTPEISFSVVNPIGSDKMGEMIEVPRA